MKKDIFNHHAQYETWKKQLTPDYIEEGLTKQNSQFLINYLLDLEKGVNIPKSAKKGGRDIKTINRLRSKISCILKLLQKRGIKDISKAKEKEIVDFFHEWNKTHSPDYAKRFKAFWHWWMTKNRREGNLIVDITEDLTTIQTNGKAESDFVWLTKEEFDKLRSFFDEDKQTLLTFCFDSLIRAPTELFSLKVENIFEKNEEVWVNIPTDISKTIGRKFNLVYSGKMVLDYIQRNEKKSEEYLFEGISYTMLNSEMQKVAKQLFGDKKSEGGEYFKNITLYDLRHSGAIHFRQLFQKTGQSLDLLRERGGWSDFKMINYYTKRLGLDGHIQKEKLLLQEDKTKLEEELSLVKQSNENLTKQFKEINDKYNRLFEGKDFMKLIMNFAQNRDEFKKEIEKFYGKDFDVVV